MSFSIASVGSGMSLLLVSSFHTQGKPLNKYLFSTLTASQNFRPNLTGLLAIYWMKLLCALHGNSCSSIVMFHCGMNAFWQFDMKLFQSCETRANLSCKRFLRLSVFRSKRKNLTISTNISLGVI